MAAKSTRRTKHQALRLRRALIGAAGSVAFVVLVLIARLIGVVAVPDALFWLFAAPWLAGSVGFVLFVITGRNLALADPSMTLPQILWAATGPICLFPFVPDLAELSYLALLVIGYFGAFRLANLHYLVTNAVLAAAMGLAFFVQQFLWGADVALGPAALGFSAFLCALGVVTAVGFEVVGFRRKLTERNHELTHAFERLRDLAIRDELTGLHNRRYLMDVLKKQRALADRSPEHCFSLCFVDLDHFKRVNDVFGHAKGDVVLQRFAEIARRTVRAVDYVARIGGEEFVLVLVGTPEQNAAIVAERIRSQTARLVISDLLPDFRISASCGITEYRHPEDIEQSISRADGALYEAKRSGRDRIVIAGQDAAAGSPPESERPSPEQQAPEANPERRSRTATEGGAP
ncbi:MAG: diguanylate cyclase [Pseudomonadales bacterium]|jgi:diguanylate cyclase (GGDEF)-like protein|nr:diguanylate cyclase [Pseudomonadales bacterium]